MGDYLRGQSLEQFESTIKKCIDKVEGLNDLDWEDIVATDKLGIHRDVLRKAFNAPLGGYSVHKYYQHKIANMQGNEMVEEIEEKLKELKKEKIKIQTLNIERNKIDRLDTRKEFFYENVANVIQALPLPDFKRVDLDLSDEEAWVLAWADLHYGANFTSQNNSYSMEECERRMMKLVANVERKIALNDINNLVVTSLGDDVQGILRISDLKLNETPVVESVVKVSRLIANVLNELSASANITYYHCMESNHTQTRPLTGKPDLKQEDLQFIIGNYIKDLLADNERIEVVLSDKGYSTFELCGQNIITMHGHQVRNVKKCISDLSMMHRKFYDIALLGHLHGGQQLSVGEGNGNTEVYIIPSVVGSDPYSDSLMVGSKSMAKMFKIERNKGITESYTFVLN